MHPTNSYRIAKNVGNFKAIINPNFQAMDAAIHNSIARKELLDANVGERPITAVKIVEIEFPAGQKAPYHKHPCPVVGQIVSGTCLVHVEGEAPQILKAGDAFFEPANVPVIHFDNHSNTEPMKFVAYYLLNGNQELIELLSSEHNG